MRTLARCIVLLAASAACGNAERPETEGPVEVAVIPDTATLGLQGSRSFLAAVTGSLNVTVTWTMQEGSGAGVVDENGGYTAPAVAGTFHVVATSVADPTKSGSATVTVRPETGATQVLVDHRSVSAEAIPVAYLDAARRLDVVFQHKSVGTNITDGLKTLAAQNPSRYGVNVVGWPYWWTDDTGGHDGTPPPAAWYTTHDGIGSWENGTSGVASTKTSAFDTLIRSGYGAVAQVALMKFCFEEIWSGTGLETWNLYRPVMEGLIRDYPDVTFVWVTMPLAYIGNYNDSENYGLPAYDFNNHLRAYIAANGGHLFDIADIETYSADGTANFDRQGHPSLSVDWAAGSNDPHLNTAGQARMANAWWYLMARIAGYAP